MLQGPGFSILVEKTYFFCQMTKTFFLQSFPDQVQQGKSSLAKKIVGLDFDT